VHTGGVAGYFGRIWDRALALRASRSDRPSSARSSTVDRPNNHVVPDQLRLIGDELHEQLRFHHRSAGCCRAGFPCAMQSELLIATDGL
jgi:hypothetical protein